MTDPRSETTPRMTPEAARAQARQQRAVIVDVREPAEYAQEHVEEALSVPIAELTPERLPDGATAVLYCGAGKRACAAAQRLMGSGCLDVKVLDGGLAGWKAAGLPTSSSPQAAAHEGPRSVGDGSEGRA
jgi:rhodanese-related sulfurtransferase